jgi:hypothetical protein
VRNIITDEPQAIIRTALNLDGTAVKVDGKTVRKALGPIGGGAVKLTDKGEVTMCLGVGEGVETVLSMRKTPGFGPASPVWALISAGGLASFPVLAATESLWIAVDNDKPDQHGRQAGIEAAFACSKRWTAAGCEVYRPPAFPAQEDAQPHGHPARTPAHDGGCYVAAGVLALAAVALGGIQLAIDAQYAGSFGRTPFETLLQGTQGIAIGIVAMILPCVASVLRRTGQMGSSWGAWAIWSGFLVLTILAGMGFSAGGLSDAIAGRTGAIEQAVGTKEQRAQAIATAQRTADTATEARKAECAPIRGPRCRDREADERTALAALNAAIAMPLPPTVSISASDPGADAAAANVFWASFGLLRATAADIERTWITGRAVMPAFAGLLLSMAIMVWPRRRW